MKRMMLILLVFSVLLACGCGRDEGVSYDLNRETSRDTGAADPEGETPDGEENGETEGERAQDEPEQAGTVVVYVCGAVRNSGVYELPEGSRVCDALAAAGGLAEDADERSLNQAEPLEDGLQITVYTKEEAEALPLSGEAASGNGKVNLNTAGIEQLDTLPGVGEARAKAIVQYREEHGSFSRIEEIMEIEGIKEKAFEKIRELIEV
jgi:competence protein ComEA